MSVSNFTTGQPVLVKENHLQFQACDKTVYTVASINKVQGSFSVNLLKDGRSVGVINESKLKIA